MRFFTMIKFAGIVFSLMSLAAIMSGVAATSPVNCKSRAKSFKRKVAGKWKHSVRFPLIHIYSECSPFRPPNRTWESLVSDRIKADAKRVHFFNHSMSSSRSSNIGQELDANVPVQSGSGEYLINVGFGTPQQSIFTLIDTGSDTAWVTCTQCQGCDTSATPFDSTQSSSFQSLDCTSQLCDSCDNSICQFRVDYVDGSMVSGPLVSDTITLGSQQLPNFSFGCTESASGIVTNNPGLVGLGGGASSLLNQPTAESFDRTFSYCLPSLSSSAASGSLVLGKEALSTSGLQFTPLIQDPSNTTFHYLVNLNQISVGDTAIPVPAPSWGGTVVDSGTPITRLETSVYMAFRDAFRAELPDLQPTSVSQFDTCYDFSSASVDVPTITLHFDGNVHLALPRENIVTEIESGTECLAFLASESISILGNVQQQNFRVVFDVPNAQLGFVQEQCTS